MVAPPRSGSVPLPTALPLALDSHPVLARLREQIRGSRARLDAVVDLLPAGLRSSVQAGPLDEGGWTLLVPHGAAAAKLRQLTPLIEQRLVERGWEPNPLRVRIQRVSPLVTSGR